MSSPNRLNELLDRLMQNEGDPTDLTTTLHHIVQTARLVFEVSCCSIFAINPITLGFTASQTIMSDNEGNEHETDQAYPERLAEQTLQQGIVRIDNLDEQLEFHSQFTRAHHIHSLLTYPLLIRHNHKPLGILCLYFQDAHVPLAEDEETQQSFRVFLTQIAFLLQQTWLLRRHQEVARIGQEINQKPSDIDTLFKKLCQHVTGILDIDTSLLLVIYEPQKNLFDIYLQERGASPRHELETPAGASFYVLKKKEKLFIQHLSQEGKNNPFQISHIPDTEANESFIYIPLLLQDASLGVISIQHPSPHAYDQEDLFIVQMLANHIALAIWNTYFYSSLSLLNQTAQLLTSQADTSSILQATADKILEATKADIIVLYSYFSFKQDFSSSPYVSGTLKKPRPSELMIPRRVDDIARLMLKQEKPFFAHKANDLYTFLQDDDTLPQGNFQIREGIRSAFAARLTVGDEIVGVLFVNFRQPQVFDDPQSLLIEGLSHFAAIAITNARTLDTIAQRRIQELEILQQVDQNLNRHLDLQSVLDTLLNEVSRRRAVPADGMGILIYNPQTQLLETRAAIGRSSHARRQVNIALNSTTGITRWVLENKRTARVDNVQTSNEWRDIYIPADKKTPTVSELDVPLLDITSGEIVGVINCESEVEAAFSLEDQDFLETLAGQVVLAVKKAQSYEREKRLAADHRALNDISREIVAQFDQDRIFKLILNQALELTHSKLGNLFLYDPTQNNLFVAQEHNVAENMQQRRRELDEGIVGLAATQKQLINADLTLPEYREIYLKHFPNTLSELAVPLLLENELQGVINIESPQLRNFSSIDEELLTSLAALAVIAIRNARQYQAEKLEADRFHLLYEAGKELSILATYDQLKQAYNTVLRIVEQHWNAHVTLHSYNEDTQELTIISSSHPQYAPQFQTMKIDEGVVGQVVREQHIIAIADIQHLSPAIKPFRLSDPQARSLVIVPILFNQTCYGTLGVSHKEVGYFKEEDILLLKGLAQQLANTIYRLEAEQDRQQRERNIMNIESMTNLGQSAFELIHRLGSQWNILPYIGNIRDELEHNKPSNAFIAERLNKIEQVARTTLKQLEEFKKRVRESDEKTEDQPTICKAETFFDAIVAHTSLPSQPGIHFHVDVANDVSDIWAKSALVFDILNNLITNAITAMPQGGIITLSARNEGRYVALKVSDTGIGIAVNNQERIFDLYYSTKDSFGFGLWSARRNALRNDGYLSVKSQSGHGATFTLLLPKEERRS